MVSDTTARDNRAFDEVTSTEPGVGPRVSPAENNGTYPGLTVDSSSKDISKDKICDGQVPINNVGLLSYVFISWMTPLVWKTFRNRDKPVAENDIWQCSDAEGLRVNTNRLLQLWKKEVEDKGPLNASFSRTWRRFIQKRILAGVVMLTVVAIASLFSSAILVQTVILYVESSNSTLVYGLGLVGAVFLSEVTRALSFSILLIFSTQTATRFRSGLMGIMYDKLLRLRAVKGKTNAEIMNVLSVGAFRVYMATYMCCFLLAVPIYLIIGTVYCYTLIGPWCFVSIAMFITCFETQALLTKVITVLRRKSMKYTDQRVRRMREILNSMKFIKMYAWEEPFAAAIKGVRQSEQRYLLYSALINAIVGSIMPLTPTIASVVTITIYSATGHDLNASTAFAVIGTMNFPRLVLAFIPFALRAYGEAHVSFKRIQKLLLLEEYTEPSWECFNKLLAVEMKSATCVWETLDEQNDVSKKGQTTDKNMKKSGGSKSRKYSENLFGLTDIDFEVQTGKLVGICGAVGSGKSSLMSAILGRVPMIKGHLAVSGTVAYVPQQPWIVNDSLQENILFGREYNHKRYMEVITACGLEQDLQLLADGDQTEIGERGANLSGGQKQRVNLARAVYSDSDIYILDGPLSAVDGRLGKLIFHDCMQTLLKQKTVLLVTHQLQYLKHCEKVFLLDEGRIIESGLHVELLSNSGPYAAMFGIINGTAQKPTKLDNIETAVADSEQGATSVAEPADSDAEAKQTQASLNKTEERKTKGKLTSSEEMSIGDVSFATYLSYIRAAGGVTLVTLVVLMYLIASGALVFSDWWLSEWVNNLSDSNGTVNGSSISGNIDGNHSLWNTTEEPYYSDEGHTMLSVSNSTNTSVIPTAVSSMAISCNTYLLVYILSLAGIIILQLLKGFAGAKASITASNHIHNTAVDRMMRAPMSFFDTNPAGRILNRFSKDMDENDVVIPQQTNILLQVLTLVLVSLAMAAYVTPWVMLAIVPIIIVFYMIKKVSNVSIRQLKRLENVSRSPLLGHVNTTSQGLDSIISFGEQARFFERCVRLGDVASVTMLLFEISMRWIGLRLDLIACTMTVVTTLVIVLSKGYISPAAAGLLLGLCGKIVSVLQFLVRMINETEARFTSIERLNEYRTELDTEPQHANKIPSPDWPSEGGVIFRDVVMRYRPDMDAVLHGVSFEIRPREKVGIVGRTGAGKSSLAVALFRLVDLSSGHVYVDGEDISQLPLSVIRSKIYTIPQDPVLFAGTLRYNIDPFGRYSDDDIWSALEKVHMKEKVVQLDEGLEAVVEENGENFSVGERQLLCLARAVLQRSKILLLDEATANVDTTTDATIQKTIGQCFSDCTVITIAHRLNTVMHSDRIVVMDAGQVKECGAPQDILSDPDAAQTVKSLPP